MGAIRSGDRKFKLMSGDAKIKRAYAGDVKIYSSGNTVTYHVDAGVTCQEEVDEGASCLTPKTFTPTKSGWEFVGWRQETAANGNVLNSLAMEDTPVTLYAVFRQTITLSYSGNGATGGSTAVQTDYRHYNNGNVANPSFTLRSNGFSRSDYTFSKWALGSVSGTQYAAGASVSLAENTTMYAVWISVAHYFTPLNSVSWTQFDVRGDSKATISANQVALSSHKDAGVAYGQIIVRATIPTKGCTKARFTIRTGIWTIMGIECNGVLKNTIAQGSEINNNYDFNISGDSIVVEFGISSSTDYFTANAYLNSIYFYN